MQSSIIRHLVFGMNCDVFCVILLYSSFSVFEILVIAEVIFMLQPISVDPCHRMQVEVSKYTEGLNEKSLRPNGLPKSLIRYDGEKKTFSLTLTVGFTYTIINNDLYHFLFLHSARQKEKAISSITEVVQTVLHPHPNKQIADNEIANKSQSIGNDELNIDLGGGKSLENVKESSQQTDQPVASRRSSNLSKVSRKSEQLSMKG